VRRSWTRRSRIVVALATVGAFGFMFVPSAGAQTTGSSTATINLGVRSITVSPATITYSVCTDNSGNPTGTYLSLPNGTCTTASGAITVTNGTLPSDIEVQGANAIPSDSGTNWTLCQLLATNCTGASNTPGANQFAEIDYTGSSPKQFGPDFETSPQCDIAFNAGSCTAAASQAANETLSMEGPSSSTDASQSFTTVVTWTAAPS
jgi:hypothetical protein